MSRVIDALDRADTAILAKVFQPISDWSLRQFDRSCYWLAQQCNCAIVPATILEMYLRQTPLILFFGLVQIACAFWFGNSLARREKAYRSRPAVAPAALPILLWHRCFVVVGLVMCIIFPRDSLYFTLLAFWMNLSMTTAFYFASCVPRPPQMRDQRAPSNLAPSHGAA